MSKIRVDTIEAYSNGTVNTISHLSATSLDVDNKAVFKSDVDILSGQLKVSNLSAADAVVDRLIVDSIDASNVKSISLSADTISAANFIVNGDFGLGTNEPQEKLHVDGVVRADAGFKTKETNGVVREGLTQSIRVDDSDWVFVNGLLVEIRV